MNKKMRITLSIKEMVFILGIVSEALKRLDIFELIYGKGYSRRQFQSVSKAMRECLYQSVLSDNHVDKEMPFYSVKLSDIQADIIRTLAHDLISDNGYLTMDYIFHNDELIFGIMDKCKSN